MRCSRKMCTSRSNAGGSCLERSCRDEAIEILPWMHIFNIETIRTTMDMTTSGRCFCNKGVVAVATRLCCKSDIDNYKPKMLIQHGSFYNRNKVLVVTGKIENKNADIIAR